MCAALAFGWKCVESGGVLVPLPGLPELARSALLFWGIALPLLSGLLQPALVGTGQAQVRGLRTLLVRWPPSLACWHPKGPWALPESGFTVP